MQKHEHNIEKLITTQKKIAAETNFHITETDDPDKQLLS